MAEGVRKLDIPVVIVCVAAVNGDRELKHGRY